jgi:hypothetical protein
MAFGAVMAAGWLCRSYAGQMHHVTQGHHRNDRRSATRGRLAAALVVAAALAGGCTGGGPSEPPVSQPTATPPPMPTAAATPATMPATTSATTLKAPVQGLLDRDRFPTGHHQGAVRAFVVNTTWASLQPNAGGPIARPNEIDQAIDQARSSGMALKLRVRAGIDAPEWAKHIGGPPIPVYYTESTVKRAGELAGTIGRFWDPRFDAAYRDLQEKLAALYDGVPEIRQTGVTRCGTVFTETYLRNTRDPRNVRALLDAGFTREADKRCHAEQIAAHSVWRLTRSGVAFNPYQGIQPDGKSAADLPYTLAQMDYCRSTLGGRCVLENYSLSTERLCDPDYQQVYAKMRELGPPYDFQTATARKIGDYEQVLDWAVSFGASSVELPTGYRDWPVETLQRHGARLAANPITLMGATRPDTAGKSPPCPQATRDKPLRRQR